MAKGQPVPTFRHRFFEPSSLVRSYLPAFPGGGLFIRVEKPFDLWTRFELTFNLPPDGDLITCLVEVTWVNKGDPALTTGMGVRFVRLSPEDRAKLDNFLKTWARQDNLLDGRYVRIFPLSEDPDQEKPADKSLETKSDH
ncbi:MAG: PilZ domain-containing protein [Deltaproteobacteria bacterium]|nr:PilZ domain-containing protein [Deltaproteobacteria bacterium]